MAIRHKAAQSVIERSPKVAHRPTFIDVFAGCGGLSLGLMRAGWQGVFAIERDPNAFDTLSTNLNGDREGLGFDWPEWLPKTQHCISKIIQEHSKELRGLRGKIDLMAGGPPCQGFSSAGRRNAADPRNALMQEYLKLVSLIQPRLVLLENVRGITVDFAIQESKNTKNFAGLLRQELGEKYHVFSEMLTASDFGVPQSRLRFILMAVRRDAVTQPSNPFEILKQNKSRFLRSKGLLSSPTSYAALSDLESGSNGSMPSIECPGFMEISSGRPKTSFQRYSRDGHTGPISDTRLANHHPEIRARFSQIISICVAEGRLNTSLGRDLRSSFGLRKQAIRVLDPDRPAPTITSMPDDLLHYKEARTLTVRENARLQSFPDWYRFRGKYTTGGHRRKLEVPRFTQVANAVPPLLAEALGGVLLEWGSHPEH